MILSAILRVIGGLIVVAIGVSMVFKTESYLGFFGRVPWAEEKLGYEGGSRLFYKLLGVLIIFVGLMLATNLFGGFLIATIGRLFVPGNAPVR
jgi:hypothetical protein